MSTNLFIIIQSPHFQFFIFIIFKSFFLQVFFSNESSFCSVNAYDSPVSVSLSLQAFASAALSSSLTRQRRAALSACASSHREQDSSKDGETALFGGADLVIDLSAFASLTAKSTPDEGVSSLSGALAKASSLDPTPVRRALLELLCRLSEESAAAAKDALFADARASRRLALREAVREAFALSVFLFLNTYFFVRHFDDRLLRPGNELRFPFFSFFSCMYEHVRAVVLKFKIKSHKTSILVTFICDLASGVTRCGGLPSRRGWPTSRRHQSHS